MRGVYLTPASFPEPDKNRCSRRVKIVSSFPMNRFFSEKALLQIREAIAEVGGNEVFFLGRTDETKKVIEAEPLARGNRDARQASGF